MSLFRRPKKPVQRRVFSYGDDEDSENNDLNDCGTKTSAADSYSDNGTSNSSRTKTDNGSRAAKERAKSPASEKTKKKSSLLSFDDEGKTQPLLIVIVQSVGALEYDRNFISAEEGEIFQVKKSSHSRKVMKQLDRERKKRKTKPAAEGSADGQSSSYGGSGDVGGSGSSGGRGVSSERSSSSYATLSSSSGRQTTTTITAGQKHRQSNLSFSQCSNPTEVHTDDLVVRLLLSHFTKKTKKQKKKQNLNEKQIVLCARRRLHLCRPISDGRYIAHDGPAFIFTLRNIFVLLFCVPRVLFRDAKNILCVCVCACLRYANALILVFVFFFVSAFVDCRQENGTDDEKRYIKWTSGIVCRSR